MQVQFRLLETKWPSNVLSMPECGEQRSSDGRLLFAGIRVRLGIFWAPTGSIIALLNQRTKTFNVHGPGMDAAVALSDSAHGGQTVLTQRVWELVRSCGSHFVPSLAQVAIYYPGVFFD
jgi:hypothetical protein